MRRTFILISPSNVRADVIRQCHERGKDSMVDVFVELEADPRSGPSWSCGSRALEDA